MPIIKNKALGFFLAFVLTTVTYQIGTIYVLGGFFDFRAPTREEFLSCFGNLLVENGSVYVCDLMLNLSMEDQEIREKMDVGLWDNSTSAIGNINISKNNMLFHMWVKPRRIGGLSNEDGIEVELSINYLDSLKEDDEIEKLDSLRRAFEEHMNNTTSELEAFSYRISAFIYDVNSSTYVDARYVLICEKFLLNIHVISPEKQNTVAEMADMFKTAKCLTEWEEPIVLRFDIFTIAASEVNPYLDLENRSEYYT